MQDTNNNPYQPPKSQVADVDTESLPPVPAERWRRFVTYIIDYICFLGFSFLIGVVTVLLFGNAGAVFLQRIPSLLLGVCILIVYYVTQESLFSRTLGKLITGTKVVNENGGKASFLQILWRTMCRFIPFEAFSFFGSECRGWHDRIPRTFVVKSRQN